MSKAQKKRLGWKGQLILTILSIAGILLAPTTILLIAGMMPTIVATYTDLTKEKMRGITIGALNLAGCTPFVMSLWLEGHTVENALGILTDPIVWMIMYSAAGIGYCLEWIVMSTVSVFAAEQAKGRIRHIENQQQALIDRWGREVTGTIPLDEHGFPIKQVIEEK